MITQDKLKKLVRYDPCSGSFYWKGSNNGHKVGDQAGKKGQHGYVMLTLDGKLYRTHRLAWLYVHGYFPENEVDHINRNTSDNRIENLREVSRQCNCRNTKISSLNTSGVKGVNWEKWGRKWKAYITTDGKYKTLGRYESFSEAVCARLAGEQCVNWSGCDSNSPAFIYVTFMGNQVQNRRNSKKKEAITTA